MFSRKFLELCIYRRKNSRDSTTTKRVLIMNIPQDEKTNLHKICLVQIRCKYELCTQCKCGDGQIYSLLCEFGHHHNLQSFANFIFATYLHQANLGQIRFFVQCTGIQQRSQPDDLFPPCKFSQLLKTINF